MILAPACARIVPVNIFAAFMRPGSVNNSLFQVKNFPACLSVIFGPSCRIRIARITNENKKRIHLN
jgi:hypothetical protein